MTIGRHHREHSRIGSMPAYERLYRESLENTDEFWRRQAGILTWFHPPQNILDVDMEEADFSWFGGGILNASFNCVDRHLSTIGDKTGTGGSSGAAYLRSTLHHPFFPDLWAIRGEL